MKDYIESLYPTKKGSFFDFDFTDIDGAKVALGAAMKAGAKKAILVVNVASK